MGRTGRGLGGGVEGSRMNRRGVPLALFVIALLLLGAVLLSSDEPRFTEDGDLSEWTGIRETADWPGDGGSAEITGARWAPESGRLHLMLSGPVTSLRGDGIRADTLRVLL